MRVHWLVFALVELLLVSSSSADVTLFGTVRDLTGSPRYATLVVYRSDDKRVVANGNTGISGEALGKYSFSLPPGTYDLYVRAFLNLPVELTNVVVEGDVVRDITIDQTASRTPPPFLTSATTSVPVVFVADPTSTTSILLTSTQGLGSTTTLFNEFGQFTVDGVATGTIDLYDDGTHGDSRADDRVYTRNGLGSTQNAYARCNTMGAAYLFFGRINGKISGVPEVAVTAVKPSTTPIEITSLPGGAQTSQFAANIPFDIANPNSIDWVPAATKVFYQSFADSYDFLVLFPVTPFFGASGITTVVRNDVAGIGLPVLLKSV